MCESVDIVCLSLDIKISEYGLKWGQSRSYWLAELYPILIDQLVGILVSESVIMI